MPIRHLTEQSFNGTVADGIVVIDWWASWCGPCRHFGPIFEAAAARHPDVVFAKIDVEAEAGLAESFGIRSIPTLMVFRDGLMLLAEPGMVPASVLDDLVGVVKGLDMAEARRKIADRVRAAAAGGG